MTVLPKETADKIKTIGQNIRIQALAAQQEDNQVVRVDLDPVTAEALGHAIENIPDLLEKSQTYAATVATLVARYEGMRTIIRPSEIAVLLAYLNGKIKLEVWDYPATLEKVLRVVPNEEGAGQ